METELIDIVERSFRYQQGYSENQIRALHACSLSTSILSVVFGFIGITYWLRMDPTKRMVFRLQIFIALILWDFGKAVFYLCFNSIRLSHILALLETYPQDNHSFCDGWGFVVSVATFGSDASILFLTLHNAIVTFYPQFKKTYNRRIVCYNVLKVNVWEVLTFKRIPASFSSIIFKEDNKRMLINEGGLFPYRWPLFLSFSCLAFVVSALVFVNDGHYQSNFACAVPQLPVWKRLLSSYILKYVNIITITIVYSSIIIYLILKHRNLKKEREKIFDELDSNQLETGTNQLDLNSPTAIVQQLIYGSFQKELIDVSQKEHEKKINQAMKDLKSFVIYPIGYVFVWITPVISQIYNYANPDGPDFFVLRIFIALALPSSCLIDTITFLVIERPWELTTPNLIKRKLFSIKDASSIVHNDPRYNLVHNINQENNDDDNNNEGNNKDENNNNNGTNEDEVDDQSRENKYNTLVGDEEEHIGALQHLKQKLRNSSIASTSTIKSSMIRTLIDSSRRQSTNPNLEPFDESYIDSMDEYDEIDLLEFLRNGPMNLQHEEETNHE